MNYDALIVVPEPSVVEYSWDFGNGQQSAVKTPPTVFYDEIGDHEVELTTTISDVSRCCHCFNTQRQLEW